MRGTVDRLVAARGFGYIKGDDGRTYFAARDHLPTAVAFDALQVGQRVRFTPDGDVATAVTVPGGAAMRDVTRSCCACGSSWIWTARHQRYAADRGFDSPPRRCGPCRAARRAKRDSVNATESKGTDQT